ncbi:DivIVA domain-containing protein [Pseudoflavonifractor sp. 60]|uniref:DivIVA domain-containing protein n=1 Tax=Pseudoflavonifractor sp. 60 TaxID=2304576 RepID=UPI00136DCED4|nr:DivIVA domain-containing protein [Pseudoflavonifractor sp. 60]NBI67093.1 DivIVA domain-containing protein [Pseudoflavonifractor sp. 60]
MLTPQEVSERAFSKASFGGYNMAQVDEFLDVLTGDYTALFNENAVLKSKMKVLVDKVEEYRSTEDAMRKALMAAQRMADDLVQEAERKKAELLAKTESEVRARKAELVQELEAEEFRLKQAQKHTATYVERVRALHIQEAEYLSRLEDLYPPDTKPAVDPVEEKAAEIDDNVQRLLNQAMEAAAAERMRAKAAEEDEEDKDLSDTAEFTPGSAPAQEQAAPRRLADDEEDEEDGGTPPSRGGRIDFGKLQDHFGRDYEIT